MVKSSESIRILRLHTPTRVNSRAFLNFLREFRRKNTQLDLNTSIRQGTKLWQSMNTNEKSKYDRTASNKSRISAPQDNADMCCKKMKKKPACPMKRPSCPKKRKPRGCPRKPACPMKKKRRTCAKKRPACPKKRKPACPKKRKTCRPKRRNPCAKKRVKCSKPGPIMNNGYLNFVRSFRRKHCGLKPQELIQQAARAWCNLPEEKKDRYRRMQGDEEPTA
ncbi:protamine-like protein 99C isoform X2 [Drosophila tropicalis]|uniref:protamine-like protein 99C isoform X2 n=1 Tax=Drosophila tropicalis TaxID=46794 RepID=UPI0035AB7A30